MPVIAVAAVIAAKGIPAAARSVVGYSHLIRLPKACDTTHFVRHCTDEAISRCAGPAADEMRYWYEVGDAEGAVAHRRG
jgi:hypothetical protein